MFNSPTQASGTLLPDAAKKALIAASEEAKRITNELARAIYMSDAIAKIRREYPQFFRD